MAFSFEPTSSKPAAISGAHLPVHEHSRTPAWYDSELANSLLPNSIDAHRPQLLDSGTRHPGEHYLKPCGEKLLPVIAGTARELLTPDAAMLLDNFPDAALTYLGAVAIALGQLKIQKRESLRVLDLDHEVGLLPVVLNCLGIPHAYHAACFSERASRDLPICLDKLTPNSRFLLDFHSDKIQSEELRGALTTLSTQAGGAFDLLVVNGVTHHLFSAARKSPVGTLLDELLIPLASATSFDAVMVLGDYQFERSESRDDSHRIEEALKHIAQCTGAPGTPKERYFDADFLMGLAVGAGYYPFEVHWSKSFTVNGAKNSALMYHAGVFYLREHPESTDRKMA